MNYEDFATIPEGAFLKSDDQRYWIKIEQLADHHLEDCVAELFTGKIMHFSRLGKLKQIYGSEIVW